jgi:hypothetical protein
MCMHACIHVYIHTHTHTHIHTHVHTYRYTDADVIFIQEAAAAFVEQTTADDHLARKFALLKPGVLDGKRDQNSLIFACRERFVEETAVEVTEEVSSVYVCIRVCACVCMQRDL